MELFKRFVNLFKISKTPSPTNDDTVKTRKISRPTEEIKHECEKLEEEIASVSGPKSVRLAIESKAHKAQREELNDFLDGITAKAKVG